MLYALIFLALYAIGGTLYFCIASYCNLLKERDTLKANLALADECAQDAENDKGELAELANGYALMATTIEELQTSVETLVAHTQEHCQQIHALQMRGIRIVVNPINQDYTGPDECDEEPYSESTAPTLPLPLPEWADVEGLDQL